MIVTVFRSNPNTDPAVQAEYRAMAAQLGPLAKTMPGFVSIKRFMAEYGESCTIVEFEDEASHRHWVDQPAHGKAMELVKTKAFDSYNIKVCELMYTLSKP